MNNTRGRAKNIAGGIAYIGFGDLAQQIRRMFSLPGDGAGIIIFDDMLFNDRHPNAYQLADYLNDEYSNFDFYVCLGYKHSPKKKEIIDDLIRRGRRLPSHIHKTSFVGPEAKIGEGSIVYPMCNIGDGAVVGRGVVLNNSVTVSHDTVVHDCCYLAPGAIVCGYTEIGENSFIGAGAVISNGVKIGSNVIVGVGAVIAEDVADNASVIGNPMRTLKKRLCIT